MSLSLSINIQNKLFVSSSYVYISQMSEIEFICLHDMTTKHSKNRAYIFLKVIAETWYENIILSDCSSSVCYYATYSSIFI